MRFLSDPQLTSFGNRTQVLGLKFEVDDFTHKVASLSLDLDDYWNGLIHILPCVLDYNGNYECYEDSAANDLLILLTIAISGFEDCEVEEFLTLLNQQSRDKAFEKLMTNQNAQTNFESLAKSFNVVEQVA